MADQQLNPYGGNEEEVTAGMTMGGDAIFGSSPYSVQGGSVVNVYNRWDRYDAASWVYAANEALIVVGMIILFVSVFFQNDAAQNATQFAVGALLGALVSNNAMDAGANPWLGGLATAAGAGMGIFWSAM